MSDSAADIAPITSAAPSPKTMRYTRQFIIFLAIFLVFLAWVTPLLYISYDSRQDAAQRTLEVNKSNHTDMQKMQYIAYLEDTVADLLFFAELNEFPEMLAQQPADLQARVTRTMLHFMTLNPSYAQIRLLDATGMEIFRADSKDNRVHVVPQKDLEDKSDRYYFQAGIALDVGDVYMSPIDLNVEGGSVEYPPNPMIQLAAPVRTDDLSANGLVVLNVRMEPALSDALQLFESIPGHPLLLNEDGYYLIGIDHAREWGFMYGDEGKDWTLAMDDPTAWGVMWAQESGQIYTDNGYYAFETIVPTRDFPYVTKSGNDNAGKRVPFGPDSRWFVVSHLTQAQLNMGTAQERTVFSWTVGVVVLMMLAFSWLGARYYNSRQQNREQLALANKKLAGMLARVELSYGQLAETREMEEFLQTCNNVADVCAVTERYCLRIFPGKSGEMYLYDAKESNYHCAAAWGVASSAPEAIAHEAIGQDDCWALRRGQVHLAEPGGSSLRCAHHGGELAGSAICVPMGAKGERIGLLHIWCAVHRDDVDGEGEPAPMESARLAASLSDHIALSITNFRLRDSLRAQSIRDSLTGMFNRRYMEETLRREWHRVQRQSGHLALIMLDVDHFKNLNDTHGHETGDVALTMISHLLQEHVRKEDVPCRWGGEEFIVILPGLDMHNAMERAEALRVKLKQRSVNARGEALHITASFGVACFPEHGDTPEMLLAAVDAALYAAKERGRDRVETAQSIDT